MANAIHRVWKYVKILTLLFVERVRFASYVIRNEALRSLGGKFLSVGFFELITGKYLVLPFS